MKHSDDLPASASHRDANAWTDGPEPSQPRLSTHITEADAQRSSHRPFGKLAEPVSLVALAVDGAILRPNRRVAKRVTKAIKAAAEQGVIVVLATCRPPRSLNPLIKYLGLDALQITYGGAMVYDPRHPQRCPYHEAMDAEFARRVVRFARRVDPEVLVNVEILDRWYTDRWDQSPLTETAQTFGPDHIAELDTFFHWPVTKLVFLAPPRRTLKLIAECQARFGQRIALAQNDAQTIQVMSPRVNKAAALARVAEHYQTPATRVMAVGCGVDDVAMVQWAGLGVMLRNAARPVRKFADVLMPSNEFDGAAAALERYVLA